MSVEDISLEPLLNAAYPAIAGYVAQDQSFDGVATTYYGFVNKLGNWYISKQVVAGNEISWRFTKGASAYSTAFTNRAALTYDYYNSVF